LNNLTNIFLVAPALTGITSNFKSPKPPIQSKSDCQLPTPQGQAESAQNGHPDRVKAKGAAGGLKKDGGWNQFSINHR